MRILVAVGHGMMRDAILAALCGAEGAPEVALAETLEAALEAVRTGGPPDIVIVDHAIDGVRGLMRLRAAVGCRPVALLADIATPALAQEAMAAGAAGLLPRTLGPRSMRSAIRFMAEGETYLPVSLRPAAALPLAVPLTERETEVLRGICAGKFNKEIARDLGLTEATVKLHVKTLSRKLEARNRTHAAMIARDRNLV